MANISSKLRGSPVERTSVTSGEWYQEKLPELDDILQDSGGCKMFFTLSMIKKDYKKYKIRSFFKAKQI